MTAVWSAIDVDGAPHYADVALATAWLEEAARLGAPASLANLDGSPPYAQRDRALAVATALANAYRSLNVNPWRDLSWQGMWRELYSPDGTSVPAGPPSFVTYDGNRVNPTATMGRFARDAWDIYDRVTTGSRRPVLLLAARVLLNPDGSAFWGCVTPAASAACRGFEPGTLYVGHAAPEGGDCADPNDWRCLAWNDPPLQDTLRLLPPLRWSAVALGALATQLRVSLLSKLTLDVQRARAAGATAAINGEGVRPNYDVPAPAGWTRTRPSVPMGGSAELGDVGGLGGAPVQGATTPTATSTPDTSTPGTSTPGTSTPGTSPPVLLPAPGFPAAPSATTPGATAPPTIVGEGGLPPATDEATCGRMPGVALKACDVFFAADPARADRVARAAAAAAVFGDPNRGAELGPLTVAQLRELAGLPHDQAVARWHELTTALCRIPATGFATDASRTTWLAANPWCDPARVPAARNQIGGVVATTVASPGRKLVYALAGAALGAGAVYVVRRSRRARRAEAR